MVRKRLNMAFVLVLCLAVSTAASDFGEDTASSGVSAGTLESRKTRVNVYPYAFFSPEIKLAFGVGGIITFYTSEVEQLRPSKLSLSGYYSTSKQYRIGVSPQLYLSGNRVFASMKLFIQDKTVFTPDPERPEIDAAVYGVETELRIPTPISFITKDTHRKLGVIFDYQHVKARYDDEDTGEDDIEIDDPPHTLGIGISWIWDSRDNIFYPTSGHLRSLKAVAFVKDLGSSYDFNRIELDLRQYFPINSGRKQLLAAQVYVDMVGGNPPFYRVPALGGSQVMRGYKLGNLRDNNYLASQIEFRTNVWWRVGAVAFLGVGDVANEFGDFKLKHLRHSFGVGLRYTFNQSEGVNLRADLGFGEDSDGLYISVEEAF